MTQNRFGSGKLGMLAWLDRLMCLGSCSPLVTDASVGVTFFGAHSCRLVEVVALHLANGDV